MPILPFIDPHVFINRLPADQLRHSGDLPIPLQKADLAVQIRVQGQALEAVIPIGGVGRPAFSPLQIGRGSVKNRRNLPHSALWVQNLHHLPVQGPPLILRVGTVLVMLIGPDPGCQAAVRPLRDPFRLPVGQQSLGSCQGGRRQLLAQIPFVIEIIHIFHKPVAPLLNGKMGRILLASRFALLLGSGQKRRRLKGLSSGDPFSRRLQYYDQYHQGDHRRNHSGGPRNHSILHANPHLK